MKAIHRTETKPEVALRKQLHAAGLRFRKDYRIDLQGGRVRPDIVFTRQRVAVFIDSCFWHVCPQHGRQPTTNIDYWEPKLARNVERDRAGDALLKKPGWHVLRLWEHQSMEDAVSRVVVAVEVASRQ